MKDYRWVYIIIVGLVMCSVSFILRYVQNKKKNKVEEDEIDTTSDKTLVLRFPEFYRGVALVVLLLFIAISILLIMPVILGKAEVLELMWLVPFGMIILPAAGLFICWSLWKVEAGKDGFRYRNFFGKTRSYKFEELEHDYADSGLKWWFFKDGKKVLCVAYFIENDSKLIRRYRKCINKLRAKQRNSEDN
ncbi:MAG: hypothetical protein J6C79_03855 [Clostridia bacterium]|nr:hypothetical protein [Clostridia bacterium]